MTLLQVVYVHNKTQATIQSLIDVYNSLWEDSEYGQAINKPKYLAVLETKGAFFPGSVQILIRGIS